MCLSFYWVITQYILFWFILHFSNSPFFLFQQFLTTLASIIDDFARKDTVPFCDYLGQYLDKVEHRL